MNFRVFISSTSELGPYRDIARDVCEELGLLPIRMESFNAMGRGATAGSLLKLGEADVYVGILAWRYGYVEEGHARSVTAEEHRYAGERRIERLCFLTDPDHSWPIGQVDNDRSRIAAFRAEVEREIRGYFSTVDNFRAKLTSALAEWKSRHTTSHVPRPPTLEPSPDAQRAEMNRVRTLIMLCEEMPLRLLLDCYRGAVGDWVPVDDLTDAKRIVEKLTDAATDPRDVPPVLKFAIWLEQRSDDEHRRARAAHWVETMAAHHDLDDEVVNALRAAFGDRIRHQRGTDRLVVRLDDPSGVDQAVDIAGGSGEPRYLLQVRLEHGDGPSTPLPGDDDRPYLLAEIQHIVMTSIRQWARSCLSDQLSIEFSVPTALLGEPFDQWPVEEVGSEETTPLGVLFSVAVRDVVQSDQAPSPILLDRWRQLNGSHGGNRLLRWVPSHVTKLLPLRAMLLRSGNEWACLAFERFTGGRASHRFLAIGIEMNAPVILWMRAAGDDEESMLTQLRRHLVATPLPQLPAKLLDLRREAVLGEEPAPHCGQYLGLLWDDPEHRPQAASQLRTPQ